MSATRAFHAAIAKAKHAPIPVDDTETADRDDDIGDELADREEKP